MKSNYENPVQYDLDSDAYELALPGCIRVYTAEGTFELKVEEIIKEKCHLFNCVTSFEDYNYVMGQYVQNQMNMFSPEVKVLVLYYDEQLCLHATMPVRVRIEAINNDFSIHDVSYRANSRVKSFQEWQSTLIA